MSVSERTIWPLGLIGVPLAKEIKGFSNFY